MKFEKGYTEVIVNNTDITDELRTYEVNKKVSIISKIEGVRKALVKKQREYAARNTGIVMEGRDNPGAAC